MQEEVAAPVAFALDDQCQLDSVVAASANSESLKPAKVALMALMAMSASHP